MPLALAPTGVSARAAEASLVAPMAFPNAEPASSLHRVGDEIDTVFLLDRLCSM
jgi:hypothetical protein